MTADPQSRSGPLARIRARRGYYLWLAAGWFVLLLAFAPLHIPAGGPRALSDQVGSYPAAAQ